MPPKKDTLDTIINGIVNEILEGMDRDTEAELPWSEFLEFMDEATDQMQRLFNFFQTGQSKIAI